MADECECGFELDELVAVCPVCGHINPVNAEERAADRKEQDELLDEWYRTEECPYDKR